MILDFEYLAEMGDVFVLETGRSFGPPLGKVGFKSAPICQREADLDQKGRIGIDRKIDKIGQEVDIVVTNVLQTSAGRLIFGKLKGESS